MVPTPSSTCSVTNSGSATDGLLDVGAGGRRLTAP
jgi:hypothetical protein